MPLEKSKNKYVFSFLFTHLLTTNVLIHSFIQVRKKTAIEKAISDNNWQIFANLDVRDEMEMIHLASFFQALLDHVIASTSSLTRSYTYSLHAKNRSLD